VLLRVTRTWPFLVQLMLIRPFTAWLGPLVDLTIMVAGLLFFVSLGRVGQTLERRADAEAHEANAGDYARGLEHRAY
jgi:hypothetical protein